MKIKYNKENSKATWEQRRKRRRISCYIAHCNVHCFELTVTPPSTNYAHNLNTHSQYVYRSIDFSNKWNKCIVYLFASMVHLILLCILMSLLRAEFYLTFMLKRDFFAFCLILSFRSFSQTNKKWFNAQTNKNL